MNLSSILINETIKVISVIGAGGKTNFLRTLAAENRDTKKILLTSTVNMERIPESEVDFIDYEYRDDYLLCDFNTHGVYVLSQDLDNTNRMRGLQLSEIDEQIPCFSLSLIECDQSMQRNLKAWRENEPIISELTDMTVGLLDISAIGRIVNVDNIHNLDIFIDLTGKEAGSVISKNDLIQMVIHPDMMFKGAKGTKVLFVNKAEGTYLKGLAHGLAAELMDSSIDIIIVGSLVKKHYEVIKGNQS